ncbi:alpha/beta fold hydrolase [Nonomuraea sp. NPDC052265]|uniref:alpha/beta fold hydrolase n=1 Tax=Nonomuraea sp. NPDC052265 TaxID=3364374 RepID=UPI0037CAAFD5
MSIPSDPLLPGTHTVSVGGVDQRYHVAGAGPVCVVHPGGPGLGWEYLRMPDLERHLTLVYLEPIGTGRSGRVRDYGLGTYVRFLHGVIEQLAAPSVYLLGHSHGGFVAQRYALSRGDRLAGLILFDTSPVTGEEFWTEAMANVQRAGYADAFQRALAAVDDEAFTVALREVLPVYFAHYDEAAGVLPVRGWIAPQRAGGPPFDVRKNLGDIAAPTLIISGAHDFICGPRWGRMLHEGIPGSRFVLLEESGHMGHLEQPAVFTAAITGFAGCT